MGVSALSQHSVDSIKRMGWKNIKAHFPAMMEEMRCDNIKFDYAWSGLMAYAWHFMPYVGKVCLLYTSDAADDIRETYPY